ncbi:MAG: LemA family protein [Myxococcales bacterium]|nr:MAG: LemA family protein [Myxococcales bacterium]
MALIVIAVVVVVGVMMLVGIYNGLVSKRNIYKNQFKQIGIQLKRRHDLIPNLVNTAKGYMQHERGTLEAVIQARTQAVVATEQAEKNPGAQGSMQALAGAENFLTQSLGKLLALQEAYPDLKADKQMSELSEELRSTENKVAFARQAFNDSVMSYNTARETIPAVFFAGMFGFGPAELLEAIEQETERQVPKVEF